MTAVILEPLTTHTSTLIFLHGLGDTGHGWSSAIGNIRPTHMKVICPTAPTMSVTLNAGFQMPSWFDLRTLDISGPEDEEGIKRASSNIHKMIENEICNGIASNRIILGGFSQGGALALYAAFSFSKPLAGVIALSCWLPMHKHLQSYKVQRDDLPIFQAHGDVDPVLPHKFGQLSGSILKTIFKNASFKTYSGLSHSSSDEELQDIKDFINNWINS